MSSGLKGRNWLIPLIILEMIVASPSWAVDPELIRTKVKQQVEERQKKSLTPLQINPGKTQPPSDSSQVQNSSSIVSTNDPSATNYYRRLRPTDSVVTRLYSIWDNKITICRIQDQVYLSIWF